MAEAILNTKNLAVGYKHGRRPPRVVAHDIDVSLHRGEFVCLLGPNGAGKSTLIRTLVGMQPPLDGQVCLMGRDIADMSATEVAQVVSVVLTGSHWCWYYGCARSGRPGAISPYGLDRTLYRGR